MSKLTEAQTRLTNWVISELEDGAADPNQWRAPWQKIGGGQLLAPVNATTGNYYSGGTILLLAWTALDREYTDHRWATYKQWQATGCQVLKGQRSTACVRWVTVDRVKGDPDAGRKLVPVGYNLFNVAQVARIDADTWEPSEAGAVPNDRLDALTPTEAIAHAEEFFAGIGAKLDHGGDRAYYNRITDTIVMPLRDQFANAEGYYATLGHEHVHWTGNLSRLDRWADAKADREDGASAKEVYAFEELVAELGSTFLNARLSIDAEPRADHAHYLASWLGALKGDTKYLWKAAGLASKAVEYLVQAGASEADSGAPGVSGGTLEEVSV